MDLPVAGSNVYGGLIQTKLLEYTRARQAFWEEKHRRGMACLLVHHNPRPTYFQSSELFAVYFLYISLFEWAFPQGYHEPKELRPQPNYHSSNNLVPIGSRGAVCVTMDSTRAERGQVLGMLCSMRRVA